MFGLFKRKTSTPRPSFVQGMTIISYDPPGDTTDVSAVFRGGGGGGSGICAYTIDCSLEGKTREIALAMEGPQPNDHDWDIFFMRAGGGMSPDIDKKMQLAHTIAKNLKLST